MSDNNDALRKALIDAVTDYRYLLTIVEDRQNLHGWLRMRIGVLDAVIDTNKPEPQPKYSRMSDGRVVFENLEELLAYDYSKPGPSGHLEDVHGAVAGGAEHTEQSEREELIAELDRLDDYIARIEGNDRGSCESINVIRTALLAADKHTESEKEYFAKRPQIDCNDRRVVFRAGFAAGMAAGKATASGGIIADLQRTVDALKREEDGGWSPDAHAMLNRLATSIHMLAADKAGHYTHADVTQAHTDGYRLGLSQKDKAGGAAVAEIRDAGFHGSSMDFLPSIRWLDARAAIALKASDKLYTRPQPQAEALEPRDLRVFLQSLQAGEMSVGRAIEILGAWRDGRYSDDMVPPPPEDSCLIKDDEFPMQIVRQLRSEARPVVRVPDDFPPRIMALLRDVADRNGTEQYGPWQDGNGEPLQDDADAAIAWIAARAEPPQAELETPSMSMYASVADLVEDMGHKLTEKAARAGLVVTIERRPLQPPAMGHAEYVIETRPVRNAA